MGRGTSVLATLALLVAPLLLLLGSPPADAAGLSCLPSSSSACVAGTLRTEVGTVADVKISLKAPDGTSQDTTTSSTGQWGFTVTKTGKYTVSIDESTLPKGLVVDKGTVTVTVSAMATSIAPVFNVRTSAYKSTTSKWSDLAQGTANGILLGLLLALASVGLSLIYGTTGLSNFAHAEQVTMGGMVGYFLCNVHNMGLWLGGLLVVIFCGFTGWFQDVILWRPLRRRGLGLTQLMIVTIGLSLALQYSYQYLVSSRTVQVKVSIPKNHHLGPIDLSSLSLYAMLISVLVLSGVGYALLRTRIGRATRAVSDNPALAQASGIDTDRVIRLVWTVAMALAGLSGFMYALVNQGVKWDTGLQILLLLFAAVTLGGLGTAFGALVGSLVIGLVINLAPQVNINLGLFHLSIPGDFKYAAALLMLILVLLVRPQGLLGKAQRIG
jgi:branched-chain amino acid transport system permease protein